MKKKNKSIFYIFLLAITSFLIFKGIDRNQKLSNESVVGVCKLVDLKRKTKGVTTREYVAVVEYFVNGIKYSKTLPAYPDIKIGLCYETLVVPTSPKIIEVDFNKSIDCKIYQNSQS